MDDNMKRISQDIVIEVIPHPANPQRVMGKNRKTESQKINTEQIPHPANQKHVKEKGDDLLGLFYVLL